MQLQDELLTIERRLWTNDTQEYDRHLTGDALLVFGETGVISKSTAIEAIRQENTDGRRWADVAFDDVGTLELGTDSALLTYRVRARWANDTSRMSALASSVYVKNGEGWKLAFHQQTPVGSEPAHVRTATRATGADAVGASSAGAVALGSMAVGAAALGAVAIGALAIGRMAVGRADVKRARIRSLSVDELEIGRLRVHEQS